jgi:hypothetical protein
MSAPLTNWYDEVLPLIPGVAPGQLALRAIIGAVIEFCRKSKAWEIDHPAVSVVANTSTYAFAPGTGMQVIAPINVFVNGLEIDPASPTDLDTTIPGWRTTPADPAQNYYCPDEDSIRIAPTPASSITGGLTMRVAVAPTADQTTVLDRFWNHLDYRDAITNGALAYMFNMNNMPWTDANEATKRQSMFNDAIGKFDAQRAKGRSRRPMRSYVIHGVK